ncbi:MAG: DNA recombination protein RmuC [Paludibacter sp.]
MQIVYIFIALAAGFSMGVSLYLFRTAKKTKQHELELNEIATRLNESEKLKDIATTTLSIKQDENLQLKEELARNLEKINELIASNASFGTANTNLLEKIEEQKKETEELQKRLTTEFENIAGRILKNRSDEFSVTNTKALNELLHPLKERIVSFEKKVDETYDKELRDRISLREEVKKLTELNTRVSVEANNLTKALKGDVKKQGNWGEIILERVLERSGLVRGQEYEREEVVEGADKSVQRPDVIVHLPDNKHIVIDSKVSLVAYERYINAETDEIQAIAIKEHIASIRSHVKLLSDKNYFNATQLNSPDFVLMFIPVEASFSIAVQADADLFSFAWDKKIVIVSPTTLLATLRTISSIWKQENQTRNAQEIARLSGTLYDKFIGFAEDMSKIKLNIDKASGAYDDALRKMKDGNGNIIRTAEKIKELGAKTGNKSLPQSFEL